MKYFLYCRKSTDTEDKQVLSLDSQRLEMLKLTRTWKDIEIVEVYEEARSAKKPGRPIFGAMVQRIVAGDAEGIIAWHPDRLTRNTVDGGLIVFLIDEGKIKDLKFATMSVENTSQGKFMLQNMFTHAKYYIDALRENVRRGMRTKAELGWYPGPAKVGYLNDATTRSAIPDPNRFELLQRALRCVALRQETPERARETLNKEWGFRTKRTRRTGGDELSRSSWYRILSDRYYAGLFEWEGRIHRGKHQPMITLDEFESIQRLLHQDGRPKATQRSFAYTGLFRCTCGLAVTAETKRNRWGSEYTYYHCTRKRHGSRCGQPSIEVRLLEEQLLQFLRSVSVPDKVVAWLARRLHLDADALAAHEAERAKAIEDGLRSVSVETDNLIQLRIRNHISEAEYLAQRRPIDERRIVLEEARASVTNPNWIEPYELFISFCNRAAEWFRIADSATKRLIVQTVGSNPYINSKELIIEARKPFRHGGVFADRPSWLAFRDDVRTRIQDNDPEMLKILANIHEIQNRISGSNPSQEMAA